jgi:hypothetical protein
MRASAFGCASSALRTNDLVGNHLSIGFNVLAPAMGNLQSGRLSDAALES